MHERGGVEDLQGRGGREHLVRRLRGARGAAPVLRDGLPAGDAERRQEKREETEKLHRIERVYGSFARRFALPENADEQGIRAESRDGVILIHIPKAKVVEPQPRQITIQ